MMEVEDGASLEMSIRLPPSMPLRPPEVECRKKVGGWGIGDVTGAVKVAAGQ
jgi:ubiquitin-protein ligase